MLMVESMLERPAPATVSPNPLMLLPIPLGHNFQSVMISAMGQTLSIQAKKPSKRALIS
jgi:hypothetical protein